LENQCYHLKKHHYVLSMFHPSAEQSSDVSPLSKAIAALTIKKERNPR